MVLVEVEEVITVQPMKPPRPRARDTISSRGEEWGREGCSGGKDERPDDYRGTGPITPVDTLVLNAQKVGGHYVPGFINNPQPFCL